MFKSYHKILISATLALAVTTVASIAGNNESRTYPNGKKVIDGGSTYPVVDGKTASYFVNTQKNEVKFGREATKNEIKAWDIDVMPDGTGLPEGSGTVEDGDEIYETQCASCHGDFGAGGAGYPAFQKGNAYEGQKSLKNQRVNGNDEGPVRNFGSYWPKASTLWWYIKTGMPHPSPMSLTDDETYALVAYILSLNEIKIDGEIVNDEYELDREKFMKIVMPNVDGFEPKIDGPDGIENVRAYFNDFSNYGNGTRCMKDCFEGEPVLSKISGSGISDYQPPISTKKELPGEKKVESLPGQKTYESTCSVCHATEDMGAPAVGDRKAWLSVVSKGMDKVYENAINGINGMPPKGGNSSLTEAQMKEVVDYMIEASK